MKIERLYKLNQFVDKIYKKCEGVNAIIFEEYMKSIFTYNDRLKQSVTKEMVANLESQDWVNKDGSINVKIQLRWMEAEKKVIFETNENYKLLFNGSQLILFEIIAGANIPIGGFINSLSKLAEATNGQLKLKNFEI